MRIAAIYDIHGNLPALEAVLADIAETGVDEIVVGGDIVPGPMSREVLERLLAVDLPIQFIYGNCEIAMLAQLAGKKLTSLPEQVRENLAWSGEQFNSEQIQSISDWPKTLQIKVPELGEVLFCHGTPRDENEIFTYRTSDQRLQPAFNDVNASIVVCGHTHIQFQRPFGTMQIVNAGSVGMPFGEPGAYWLLLGPTIELRRTPYNLAEAASRVRATKYPQADDFAERYVLNPPTEREMLELFSRFETSNSPESK